jgi:hypothetical protein
MLLGNGVEFSPRPKKPEGKIAGWRGGALFLVQTQKSKKGEK